MEELNIVYKPIKELKPYKKNAKKHSKEQVEQIANSIKEFGFTQPVIIDKHNSVVAGHGRILGAKKAGLKQVPTVCLEDLTEEQIKAYRLVDNKLNESEWDDVLLAQELEELVLYCVSLRSSYMVLVLLLVYKQCLVLPRSSFF
jgi:ParB family transcriptional regulator, chromosome partitioning protein